jgi:hypothetical protein
MANGMIKTAIHQAGHIALSQPRDTWIAQHITVLNKREREGRDGFTESRHWRLHLDGATNAYRRLENKLEI